MNLSFKILWCSNFGHGFFDFFFSAGRVVPRLLDRGHEPGEAVEQPADAGPPAEVEARGDEGEGDAAAGPGDEDV